MLLSLTQTAYWVQKGANVLFHKSAALIERWWPQPLGALIVLSRAECVCSCQSASVPLTVLVWLVALEKQPADVSTELAA